MQDDYGADGMIEVPYAPIVTSIGVLQERYHEGRLRSAPMRTPLRK